MPCAPATVDGIIVRWSVGLDAPDDPDVGRWCVNALGFFRKLKFFDQPFAQIRPPSLRNNDKVSRLRAGGAPTWRCEKALGLTVPQSILRRRCESVCEMRRRSF
jgi:hypothetical protein